MTARKASAIYMIVVGFLIIFLWIFLISTGSVPEFDEASLEISFHIAAEIITAILLVSAGSGLIKASRWAAPLSYISLGALLYSIINSSGYYAQRSQISFLIMFAALLVFTIAAIILVHYNSHSE